jgi:hypothetical protein
MLLPYLSVRKSGSFRILVFFQGIILMVLFSLALCFETLAQGNLLILPRRVVFEGNLKSQELTLANTGNDTAKYQVSIVQMRMKEDGSFEPITTPDEGQFFADKFLRFYPRTVTLAPKKSQIIKMQFAKSSQMEPGEYRSHIYFRSISKSKPLGENEVKKDSASVTAKLVPVFGITIPVIIRIGESTAQVKLTNLALEMVKDTLPKFKLTFNRSGNFSVYGDLLITHISPKGKQTKVAAVKGVAVYTPNQVRRFQCNLDRMSDIDYKSGKLHVVFSTPVDTKPQKLAEADYPLE